jgi:hypothetical protein
VCVCVVEGASRFHFTLWAPCLVLCIHFLCLGVQVVGMKLKKSSHEVCRDCGIMWIGAAALGNEKKRLFV